MLGLRLDPGSASPIYAQLVVQLAQAVRAGELAPGDALPSVRALAEQLTINPNTVARAYSELAALGLVQGRQGRGFVVVIPRAVFSAAERNRRLDEVLDPVVAAALRLGLDRDSVLAALRRRFDKEGIP